MLAALCLSMVFAISLSSYIALCYASLNMSTRTMAISHSNELAEAGIEEALYALNNNDLSSFTPSGSNTSATMTMTSSGLVLTSTNPTPLNYGNGVTGQVQITIYNYANFSISSPSSNSSPGPSIAAVTTMTLPAYSTAGTTRTISTTSTYGASTSPATAAGPLFVNAVAAISGTVRFRSAGTVDSYNSNPSSGVYQAYSSGVAGYSAVILSQDNTTSSATVRLLNAVVHGYAVGYNYTSPSSTNWFSYSTSGMLVGPTTPTGTSIDSSRLETTAVPYQPILIENMPTNYTTLPTACTTDGMTINKTATLGSTTATTPVVYDAGNGITLANKILTIQGPVVIICYSDVTLTGSGQIQLTTPQASLQIFLEYGNLNLGGNGITNTNVVPLPKKVAIMSTTNQWGSITMSTNTPYYGELYFPYLTVTVSSQTPYIYGSIIGSAVSFTNSPTFHYDRALRTPTPAYTSSIPLQSGAAFDNLSAPATFGGLVTTAL
jgi:hypothetical protein